ncbi:MAG: outer membrane lipoprotein-sorting protein [Deltaproteobacteria bacterium]|nr:outer membrane lipoprotein-sorting protein [Deltaproteobacteria bacterium]
MSNSKLMRYVLAICLSALIFPQATWAAGEWPDPDTYVPTYKEIMKQKATVDDNRDAVVTFHPKDIVPPEVWDLMHWDVGKMEELWAEIVGFKAPDLVGKIAPDIKPGKYTYKDVEQTPGLKELFPEYVQATIKPGAPPVICNLMDFEIEPTRQLHLALPAAEITKRNMGKTKLDKDGYMVKGTWGGGVPFPRPSGKFKAQQVYYNYEKRCGQYDDNYRLAGEAWAFDKNLKVDKFSAYARTVVKLMGRTFMTPYGWFDERAEKRGQFLADLVEIYEPRANRGLIRLLLRYDDPQKMDPMMMYLPQLRRIRKMSSTDTQDPLGDSAYDDTGFISQKITPKRYPYEFEIIEEREYLLPFSYNAGKAWLDSKNGYAIRDLGLQRRPCYVLQMNQLDPNYIYSKRIYYVDKESFIIGWGAFYDQKGRLWRTYNVSRSFLPECGQILSHGVPAWQVDYLDSHSSAQMLTSVPAQYSRRHINIENVIKKGK